MVPILPAGSSFIVCLFPLLHGFSCVRTDTRIVLIQRKCQEASKPQSKGRCNFGLHGNIWFNISKYWNLHCYAAWTCKINEPPWAVNLALMLNYVNGAIANILISPLPKSNNLGKCDLLHVISFLQLNIIGLCKQCTQRSVEFSSVQWIQEPALFTSSDISTIWL